MTTINLYQDQQEAQRKLLSTSGNGGLFISLGILVLTFLVLGGLKFSVYTLEKESVALEQSAKAENTSLAGFGELDRIADLQARLEQIKSNLQVKNNVVTRMQMNDVLDRLGSDLSSGIVITSYKFDSGKIKVSFKAGNFNDASRQILNFKKSSNFSDVNLTSISRDETGVKSDVEMSIKK